METLRPLLTTYAYNITGSYEDAKDIVQEAYLRFMNVTQHIENEKAYLIRTVINLSINFKSRQKKLLPQYPGIWLPEPVATEKTDAAIISKETLSYSLMVLLEKLNAKQRAVFILKEAFSYEHEDIAEVIGITAENSRKILSRAKEQLKATVTKTSKKISSAYLDNYIDVIHNTDIKALEKLLNEDILLVSDGGGKVAASLKPVAGKDHVMKFLLGVYNKFYRDQKMERAYINHQPALLYFTNNELTNCQVFTLNNGKIENIYFIRNPGKLKFLEENFK
ncbi:MAG: sigma-70 family RNA polymerase sigma factor [Parafilimonas sp.]|nr:sigma-70 family RNA polymerase sigma factor [Parafilimonas sp.]